MLGQNVSYEQQTKINANSMHLLQLARVGGDEESAWVILRECGSVNVCVERCVCVLERERECVCERERERERVMFVLEKER